VEKGVSAVRSGKAVEVRITSVSLKSRFVQVLRKYLPHTAHIASIQLCAEMTAAIYIAFGKVCTEV
jgi:hypothetical protein